MARRVGRVPPPDPFGLMMTLACGRGGPDNLPFTDEQLEWGWERYGEELMETRRPPGDRPWAHWVYDLGIEEPATRLERVLALDERGLLTEEERRKIVSQAEHARKRFRCHSFTSPPEAAKREEQSLRDTEDEEIAIAEALEARDHAR